MRIVSLLPAATEIVFALGLGDELVGVTALLRRAARGARRPRRSRGTRRAPSAGRGLGPALLELDRDALDEADPDLVILSDASRVCVVGAREMRAIADEIDEEVEVLSLDPIVGRGRAQRASRRSAR